MQYRKLKGSAIFDGRRMLADHVLITTREGVIQDVIPSPEVGDEVEIVEGVICPGFINAHCHLELSHMRGLIAEGTGMVDFLISVVKSRNNVPGNKTEAIAAAEKELYENGTSGVADICNTTDALGVKSRSRMRWHNLIEVINFNDANLDKALASYGEVLQKYQEGGQPALLTPHAPYSVSDGLYTAINTSTAGGIISMHNGESAAENTLFKSGSGDFLRLYAEFGNGVSPFPVTGKSSLQTWLPHFTNGQTIILVHNTFTSEEDIIFAKEHAVKHGLQLFYCLCPNANLYIEGARPPVQMFMKHNCAIVIGTDSYSSNHQLSIGTEMATLKEHFPDIAFTTLLTWATANGAAGLRWNDLGCFSQGTKPGVVAINENSFTVKRLI